MTAFCQKLTTELTEKMFYFKKLTEILLPPLCVLSYLVSFSFYSGKMYQLSPASSSSLKKLSTDTFLCHKQAAMPWLFPSKDILQENTENPSV